MHIPCLYLAKKQMKVHIFLHALFLPLLVAVVITLIDRAAHPSAPTRSVYIGQVHFEFDFILKKIPFMLQAYIHSFVDQVRGLHKSTTILSPLGLLFLCWMIVFHKQRMNPFLFFPLSIYGLSMLFNTIPGLISDNHFHTVLNDPPVYAALILNRLQNQITPFLHLALILGFCHFFSRDKQPKSDVFVPPSY
jgi:hypothetical protein